MSDMPAGRHSVAVQQLTRHFLSPAFFGVVHSCGRRSSPLLLFQTSSRMEYVLWRPPTRPVTSLAPTVSQASLLKLAPLCQLKVHAVMTTTVRTGDMNTLPDDRGTAPAVVPPAPTPHY